MAVPRRNGEADEGKLKAMGEARATLLVVEDDPLIGWDLCDRLADAGFAVLELATSAPMALETLASATCDAAIIDINLGNHTSADVARELASRSIPFVTVSGYSAAQSEPVFQDRPRLSKPVPMQQLLSLLDRMLGRTES